MGEAEANRAVQSAAKAYGHGLGYWPTCGVATRIKVINEYIAGLQAKRDEIVNLLMWEICKTLDDAQKEVDRTIQYIKDTITELKKIENTASTYEVVQGVVGHIRRAPLGTVLVLGPFNYPLNETYTTFIPALIMGNTVVMKLPKTGSMAHFPTLELFAHIFPPGVVNILSGAGRTTMPPVMKSGLIDVFAFIGTNTAAAAMIKDHPQPEPPARLPGPGRQEPELRAAVGRPGPGGERDAAGRAELQRAALHGHQDGVRARGGGGRLPAQAGRRGGRRSRWACRGRRAPRSRRCRRRTSPPTCRR